jgi:eukaryotic-like serine/threonine-protein kinase
MDSETDKERKLFDAALLIDDSVQRDAFLDEACDGDSGLRSQIGELLLAHAESDRFFSECLPDLMDSIDLPAPPDTNRRQQIPAEMIGKRLDRYKILQILGEGGCGVVYLAEQEEPVRRRVALKVIKLGMDTKSVIARFDAERQALALMDHPNIAKVLDAGTISVVELPV